MRPSLKPLVLVAVLAASATVSPQALANCADGLTAIYRVIQCGSASATGPVPSWFAPPPAGSGTVSAAWWQVGFGNNTQTGSGTDAPDGSGFVGFPSPGRFIGNDSGLNTGDPALLDLVDASLVGGPPGSLCFSSGANWARSGNDGCADNIRTGSSALGNPNKDDNHLNPYYYSHPSLAGAGVGSYTLAYQLDAPMGILLTESNNKSFALVLLASEPRPVGNPSTDMTAKSNDGAPGNFDMQFISNGEPNPLVPGRNNIVPWQSVPTAQHKANFADPSDPQAGLIVSMTWNAVRLVHDNSTRPTGDTTLPTPGVGVLDQGTLVRYVVEAARIEESTGNCGPFTEAATTTGTSAVVTVPKDSCLRLRTIFGRTPPASDITRPNAASGRLGDIGYNVLSSTRFLGGGLLANGPIVIDSVARKGGTLTITFHTLSELGSSRYDVVGLDARGREIGVLGATGCLSCTDGLGNSYTVEVPVRGGVKAVYVLSSSGERSRTVEVR